MKLRSRAAALLLLAALSLPAMVRAANFTYLAPTDVDAVKLLPAPPAASSAEAKSELEVVLKVQSARTPEECARAQGEAKLKMTAFQSVLGANFTSENFPLTDKLLKHAGADSKLLSEAAKVMFDRPRPPKVDANVQPLLEESEPSYPSGHATRGMLYALILSELVPAQKAALVARGQEIGWDRIIAGVHYPSDLVAGRTLGLAVTQALLSNPKFQKDLAGAKAEFTAINAAQTRPAAPSPALAPVGTP